MSLTGSIFGPIVNDVFHYGYEMPQHFSQMDLAGTRMEHDAQSQQANKDFLSGTEDPRTRAALMQSMYGRGLGNSSIYEQDKDRLTQIQDMRQTKMGNSISDLLARRGLLARQEQIERQKMYWDIGGEVLDTVLQIFTFGIMGGASHPGTPDDSSYGINYGANSAPSDYGGGASGGAGGGGFDFGEA